MKRVCKGPEPPTLTAFKAANSGATWEAMRRNDPQAASDCRDQAIQDQHGLCAYCEKKLDVGNLHHVQVEHFHPKSLAGSSHNWHLDWHNMLAVCDGGKSDRAKEGENTFEDNISCDTYKDRNLGKGLLTYNPGDLLNPLALPSAPNIFVVNRITGALAPAVSACAYAGVDIDKLGKTIDLLNLNCNRLCRARLGLSCAIEKRRRELLKRGHSPQKAADIMVKQYLCKQWPEYFTTYRYRLGQSAEKYLKRINYNG